MINKYPYTDFNEYNMDWIIKTVKDLTVQWAETHTEWEDTKTEWESYKNYIDNYFNNLDLSQEVSDKIDQMAADGYFADLFNTLFRADLIAETDTVVSAWINANLVQETGYVIDKSLTVEDAAADAKFTGNMIRMLETYLIRCESGGWGADGMTQTINNTRIRSVTQIPVELISSINFADGAHYGAYVMQLDKDKTFISVYGGTWYTGSKLAPSDFAAGTEYVSLVFMNRSTPNGDISGEVATVEASLSITPKIKTALDGINEVKAQKGFKTDLQLVRGFWGNTSGRPAPDNDQMRRMACVRDVMFVYAGSFMYCDTANLYRCKICKYSDPYGDKVISYTNNPIPLEKNKVVITEDGYYSFGFTRYDNGSLDVSDLYSHVTFSIYTDQETPIHTVFIGGRANNFQAPGDCTMIIGKTGKIIMIDFGLNNVEGEILDVMQDNGVKEPDYLIISHMHNDHIGGLVKMLRNNIFSLDGKTLFLPDQNGIDYAITDDFLGSASYALYTELEGYITAATDLTIIRPSTEFEKYTIDGVCFEFFNCDHSVYINAADHNYNDYSLCCNVLYGNQSICFSGDIGPIAMDENQAKNFKCNIYKAHHHGWDNITADADILAFKKWMSTVFPEIVISEDGITHDTLLHTDAPMPGWCQDNGIPFYRTNQNGEIDVKISHDSFDIMTPVIRWTADENPV